jgi:hypothetical protein
MRLLMFVSALGVLVSIAVLIAVIIKAKRTENQPPPDPKRRGKVIDVDTD